MAGADIRGVHRRKERCTVNPRGSVIAGVVVCNPMRHRRRLINQAEDQKRDSCGDARGGKRRVYRLNLWIEPRSAKPPEEGSVSSTLGAHPLTLHLGGGFRLTENERPRE